MKTDEKKPITSFDDYISSFPDHSQKALGQLRKIIKKAAPHAEEVISYAMPAFKQSGMVMWYAACKNHYAIYIRPKMHEIFKEELFPYEETKAAVKFSYDNPLPEKLIADITKRIIEENEENVRLKNAVKKSNKIR